MTKQSTDPRVEKLAERLRLGAGSAGEESNAKSILAGLTVKGRRSKRRITPRLVTATCQYPDASPLHTFEYAKTTKPQVYCPPHRDGWVDDEGEKHGGERNVRVIRDPETKQVIGRRLVVEEHVPVEDVMGIVRRSAAQWLQWLGVPMLGDLHPDAEVPAHTGKVGDPFEWVEVDRTESPGIVAVTRVIAFESSPARIGDGEDPRPRPRFDPTLIRLLTTEEREVQPSGTNSLDVGDGQHGSQSAPGILPDPPQEPPLIADASQLHVAVARLVLGIADRDTLRWVRARRDADPAKYAEVRDQVLIVMEARREIPVLNGAGPPRRRLTRSGKDHQ